MRFVNYTQIMMINDQVCSFSLNHYTSSSNFDSVHLHVNVYGHETSDWGTSDCQTPLGAGHLSPIPIGFIVVFAFIVTRRQTIRLQTCQTPLGAGHQSYQISVRSAQSV